MTDGKRVKGTMKFENGDTYCGQFNDEGLMHGEGKYTWANGNTCEYDWTPLI